MAPAGPQDGVPLRARIDNLDTAIEAGAGAVLTPTFHGFACHWGFSIEPWRLASPSDKARSTAGSIPTSPFLDLFVTACASLAAVQVVLNACAAQHRL
jgi:hypothetical protein